MRVHCSRLEHAGTRTNTHAQTHILVDPKSTPKTNTLNAKHNKTNTQTTTHTHTRTRAGAIGWNAWIFSVIAGVSLYFLNTYLIAALRSATRGGAVRPLAAAAGWSRRHALLLPLIKLLLFCLSFVVSNTVFFAAFYGPESCPFSRTGACCV